MKTYFIAFDFYNSKINKFISRIVEIDLKTTSIISVAKDMIKEDFKNINFDNLTIKITVFNNIS